MPTEQSKQDTTDTEQRFGMYMKDNFLEYLLESLEWKSVDNFNWCVRRRSYLEGELVGGVEQSLPQHNPVGGEECSDEELESVSPVDYMSGRNTEEHSGVSSSVSTTSGGVYPPSSLLLEIETESGECGEGEMSSLTPCNASPSLSELLFWSGCRCLDDVQENWRPHVQKLMISSSQDNLVHTFALFASLLKDLRTRTVGLSGDESCVFLRRDESVFSGQLKGAVGQFQTLLCVLSGVADCPQVCCDFNLLGGSRPTEKIKFNVLEIQENIENYVDKKNITLSCLEGLKAHAKLLSLGVSLDSCTNMESDQVELFWFLYKLHFQQLLLQESYSRLLASINGVADLSEEVAGVMNNLLTSLADTLSQPGIATNSSQGFLNRASTPSNTTSPVEPGFKKPVSPAPRRASPPCEQEKEGRVGSSDNVGEQSPTPSCSETDELATESLFSPPIPLVALPEISLTLPSRSASLPIEEGDSSMIDQEVIFITELSPNPAPLPDTQSEAKSLLLSHLASSRLRDT